MKNLKNKGFTLIELLVVIAIIGILSSVVLASLNTARARGSDAAIKADVSGVRAAAELYYDSFPNAYGSAAAFYDASCSVTPTASSVSADTTVQQQIDDAFSKNGGVEAQCAGAPGWYVIAVPLRSNPLLGWCVDSSGNSMQITLANFTAATDTTCVIANT